MKKDQLDEEFLNSIRDELEDSAAGLDAETLSKLNQMRQSALSRIGKPERNNIFVNTSTALATCLILAIIVFYPEVTNENLNNTQMDLIDDLELLSTKDDLNFLEDLDFYQWLEEYEPQV